MSGYKYKLLMTAEALVEASRESSTPLTSKINSLRAALAAYDAEQTSGDAAWAIARMKEGKWVRPEDEPISFRLNESDDLECWCVEDYGIEDDAIEFLCTFLLAADKWHLTNNDFAKP